MRKLTLLSTVAIIIVLASCTKKPTAGFTISNSGDIEIGDKVEFINRSTDAVSYEWNFGDGETHISTSPTHEYSESGTFYVSLKAMNKDKIDIYSKSITINSCDLNPYASFSILTSGTIEEYQEVEFKNNSIDAESYSWDFGDDKTSSLETPTHKYYNAGTYTIILTVNGCNKTDTYSKAIVVEEEKGSVVFWTDFYGSNISVYLDGNYEGQITQYYSITPDCGDYGCVTIEGVESGYHSFSADNGSGTWSNSSFYIGTSCLRYNLTSKKSNNIDNNNEENMIDYITINK